MIGDPRGLFTLLCASGPPPAAIQAALGIVLPSSSTSAAPPPPAASLDLTEAVTSALQAVRLSQSAKVIIIDDSSYMFLRGYSTHLPAITSNHTS